MTDNPMKDMLDLLWGMMPTEQKIDILKAGLFDVAHEHDIMKVATFASTQQTLRNHVEINRILEHLGLQPLEGDDLKAAIDKTSEEARERTAHDPIASEAIKEFEKMIKAKR